jgi:hypothetical protein
VKIGTGSGPILTHSRNVYDAVGDEDPTTTDLLHIIFDNLERYARMVSAGRESSEATPDALRSRGEHTASSSPYPNDLPVNELPAPLPVSGPAGPAA